MVYTLPGRSDVSVDRNAGYLPGAGSGLDYLRVMQHNVERLRSALSD